MSLEVDVHSLPDSHSHYGRAKSETNQCDSCVFARTVVNRDWASGQQPVGKICTWGKEWKWLESQLRDKRNCALLSRSPSEKSTSNKTIELEYCPVGIRPDDLNLILFEKVIRLYRKTVGGRLPEGSMEYYFESVKEDLSTTNVAQLRLGSFVSGDSKLEIEWRSVSPVSSERVLFFSCYPNTGFGKNQGEYLSSRFELATKTLFEKQNIAVTISK